MTMKKRYLKNLLNNAAAVIETGDDTLPDRVRADLVDDLLLAAEELEGGDSGQDQDEHDSDDPEPDDPAPHMPVGLID